MRKIFSFLTAILFAGSMMAADPVTVKSTFTKATTPANDAVTDLEGVVTWSIATEVGAGTPSYTTGKNTQIECLKFGAKAAEYFSKVTLSTDYYEDYNVKSVTLYVLNNGKKTGTLTVKQGETTIGTDSKEFGTAWTALTATGVTGNGGTLEVSYEVAQASYWSYIEVQYETAQGGETPSTIKTLYCKVAQDWWKDGNAAVGIYAFKGEAKNAEFPGVRMTPVEGETDLWKAEIDTALYNTVIFTRFNPNDCNTENCLNWGAQTEDLEIPADKDLYTITSATAQWIGEGNKVTGEWSVYGEEPVVVEPAKFYIAGDSALVVNAGLDKEQAWNPAAIKSTETSYKLNLAAGDYMLKITLNGTWDEGKVKGYDALTTVANGLTKGEGEAYDNICFTLTEAGEVSVHYDGEFFFLSGNFYVAPVEVHYYLKNNWDGGEDWTWKELVYNEENEDYELVAVFGGTGVDFNTSASDVESKYIGIEEIETYGDAIGALDTVLFFFVPDLVDQYTPGANGLFAVIIGKYVAPVNRLENGYYLFGSAQEWNVANLTTEDKFAANPNSGDVEEYVLTATLAKDQAFKVVYVENDAIKTYYPDGTDNNYVVDAAHVGETDIYFRPNYNGSEDWHNNCIYVLPTSGTAIDKVAGEAKAVKILKNGMLIIEKNGVKYNVLGVRL